MDLNLRKETSYFFSNSIPPRVIFSYILANQRILHTFHLKIKRKKKKIYIYIYIYQGEAAYAYFIQSGKVCCGLMITMIRLEKGRTRVKKMILFE